MQAPKWNPAPPVVKKEKKPLPPGQRIHYLSYSAFKLFEQDPEKYYLRYMTKNDAARDPQNHHMAVGSAVDAFIKAELYKRLIGKGDPAFELQTLFEAQVESPQRDQAWVAGAKLFELYEKLGGLKNILECMRGCVGEPRFEKEIVGPVEGVIILGRPDIHYIHRMGARIVHDFKAQGWYAQTKAQPKPGYLKISPGGKASRDCMPMLHKGFEINVTKTMNVSHLEWAEQLSMYAWTLGEQVGGDFILTIDHFCCDQQGGEHRLAWYAALCNSQWQREFFNRLKRAWEHIQQGHVFIGMSKAENDMKCSVLDNEVPYDPVFEALTGRIR
jgi:hypothetical protein